MSYWSVVTPYEETNICANTSGEENTNGYAAVSGGAIAQSSTVAYWGAYSIRYTPTATTTDGISYAVTLATATSHFIKVWVWGALSIPFTLQLYDVTGAVVLGSTNFTGTGAWQEVKLTATNLTHASAAVRVVKNNSASVAAFYIDGLDIIAGGANGTHIDGDQEGCRWNGTPHASTSTRLATSNAGGRIVDFDTLLSSSIFVPAQITGAGMPPMNHITISYGAVGGANFQEDVAQPMVFTLTLNIHGASYVNRHALRRLILDAFKPDRIAPQQPAMLRYDGAGKPLYVRAKYDDGLGINQWLGYSETIPLRFIADDAPAWYGEGNGSAVLDTTDSTASSYLFARTSGLWDDITGTTGAIYAIVVGPDGYWYVGGNFINAGGVAAADYVARYDPTTGTWAGLGVGTNGTVRALAVGAAYLYAGGDFTTADGGAAAHVARYDWSAGTWSAMGVGCDATVRALAVDPSVASTGLDEYVYVGGDFTNGGGTGADYAALWIAGTSYNSWTTLGGATKFNATVYAIATRPQGGVVLGGAFTNAYTTSGDYCVIYDGTNGTGMGSGMNNTVRALAVLSDTSIVAGGDFTTAGGVTVARVARWTGQAWEAMGSGLNATVWALATDAKGGVYAGGNFTNAQGGPGGFAYYIGGYWVSTGLFEGASFTAGAIALDRQDRVIYGGDTTGPILVAGSTAVTVAGSAATNPLLRYAINTTVLRYTDWLRNERNGDTLYMRIFILINERLSIDLRGAIVRSSLRPYPPAIFPVSQFGSWELLPGVNTVLCYTSSTAVLIWTERYWGIDG